MSSHRKPDPHAAKKVPKKTDRLVIVPDSCSLINWMHPIPEHFFIDNQKDPHFVPKEKRPKYFYEAFLKALPRDKIEGFQVIDIAGAETFGCNASGHRFDENFSRSNDQTAMEQLKTKIYRHSDDDFRLVKTQKGGLLISALENMSGLRRSASRFFSATDHPQKKDQEKEFRKTFRAMRVSLMADRGEEVINEYLLSHPQPTFFISEDYNARQIAKKAASQNHDGCIYVDNTAGFIETMMGKNKGQEAEGGAKNLLVDKCGLQPWLTPQQIVHQMYEGESRKPTRTVLYSGLVEVPGNRVNGGKPKPLDGWFR